MLRESVWYHHTFNAPTYPALHGNMVADVAIVGGGYTGLAAALHLAKAGRKVVLCEAGRIGAGPSGRNGGQVLSGFEAELDDVLAKLGQGDTQKVWQLIEQTRQQVVARAMAAQSDYQSGVIFTAMGPRQLQGLHESASQLQRLFGVTALQMLNQQELAAHVRSPKFVGGLYYTDAGHLNPYKYVHALAAEAEAAGVYICEQSAVRAWDSEKVVTAQGQVRAKHIILAAGADQTWPTRDFIRFKTFMMATAPLPPDMLALAFPGTAAVDDGRIFLSYARPMPDGRVIFGGVDSLIERSPARNQQRLQREMAWLYPTLANVAIEHYWSGPIDFSANLLPCVRQVAPNIYQANGFSGHGLTLTHLCGQAMAEAVLGEGVKFDLLARLRGPRLMPNRWLGLAQIGWPMLGEFVREKLGRY